jgi:hypothetical protein
MVQVFEYYINHHMKKAFESAFGWWVLVHFMHNIL